MLAGAKWRIKKADYSICHDETQFSDPNLPETSFPHYYVHPNLAKGIAATGFDECSTASNWTFDKGMSGIERTNAALRKAGVNHSGAYTSKESERNRIVVRTVNGVKLTHISYTDVSDSPTLPGQPWAVNRQSPRQIAADARAARAAGAQLVVISLAMGPMGAEDTTAAQREAVRTITADGDVDYIIGHGSHTIQPAQMVNGTWVVWHGNLMASFFPDQPRMHEGLISRATFTQQSDGNFRVTKLAVFPLLMVKDPGRVIDLAHQKCSSVPDRWASAYSAIRATERTAIKQGLTLAKPCSGT